MVTEAQNIVLLDELLYDGAHRNALDTQAQYLIALHSRGPCLALSWPWLRGVLASIVVPSCEAKCISLTPPSSTPTHHRRPLIHVATIFAWGLLCRGPVFLCSPSTRQGQGTFN